MRRTAILLVAISLFGPRPAMGTLPTILNGDFEGPFTPQGDDFVPEHWTLSEGPLEPGEISVLTSSADNGPTFPGATSVQTARVNGGTDGAGTGILQLFDPPIVVSQLTEPLLLSVDVKAISHNLCGSGFHSSRSEYPIRVDVLFWDQNDVLKYWSYGFYVWTGSPCPPPPWGLVVNGGEGIVYSEQVPADTWVTRTFDVIEQLRTLTEPKSIYDVQVVGAGWSFEGRADNIGFVTSPTAIAPSTWGDVKSMYR